MIVGLLLCKVMRNVTLRISRLIRILMTFAAELEVNEDEADTRGEIQWFFMVSDNLILFTFFIKAAFAIATNKQAFVIKNLEQNLSRFLND